MACELYLQPSSLTELAEDLKKMTEKSLVLAGGTDLMVKLRSRPVDADCILSLCKVPDMKGIEEQEGYVRIGAMETHGEIAKNPLIQEYFQALSMACDHVGSKQIRNKGTIGGSLGNASVAGDMLPVLYLFHGEIELLNQNGASRRVKAEEFSLGVGKTVLETQEVILAVWLPIHQERKSCFVKLGGRREVTIAEISLAMSWESQEGRFHQVEGILGAVDVKPIYLKEADEILGDKAVGEKEKNRLSASLSERIRIIRENRKRQPKLRIRDCEKVYKERAVKGVVYDVLNIMEEMERGYE